MEFAAKLRIFGACENLPLHGYPRGLLWGLDGGKRGKSFYGGDYFVAGGLKFACGNGSEGRWGRGFGVSNSKTRGRGTAKGRRFAPSSLCRG